MKLKFTYFLLLFAFIFIGLQSSIIDPNNPPTGRTGAPGETTCQASGCHTGGSFTGTVEISGVPDTVVASQTYPITLTHTSDATRAGFQMTVLDEANIKCGTLTAGTGSSLGNAGGRQYVRQSSPHNFTTGTTSWTFNWKAPASVTGDSIHFYFASLAANANGQKTGDNVLTNNKTVVLPPFVSAANDQAAKDWAKFYPNPVRDFLLVETTDKAQLTLTDDNGKAVLTTSVFGSQKLDVSGLPSGIYVASLRADGKSMSKLVLVK